MPDFFVLFGQSQLDHFKFRASRMPSASDAFLRKFADDDRTSIESTCKTCGSKILGSITDQLQQQEEEHLRACKSRGKGAHR
jgi:hypothetical protein